MNTHGPGTVVGMFAEVLTLGAVTRAPREGRLTLAGLEHIMIRDQVSAKSFYHVLEHNDVTAALRPEPGDVMLVRSQAIPVKNVSGSVELVPVTASCYGSGETRLDRIGGHVLVGGVNQMWADGIVATAPRRQLLYAEGDEREQTKVFNACLIVAENAGLLETVAYGLSAAALEVVGRLDRAVLQGRLLTEKRPGRDGQSRVYSRLECYRQFREERTAKPSPSGVRPQVTRTKEVHP